MDERPPNWRGNGSEFLCELGLVGTKTRRLNLSIETLGIDPTPPLDAVAVARGLLENFSVVELELHRRSISPDGVVALARSLGCNKFLEHLSMCRNSAGVRGGIAIGDALRANQTLRTLDVGWCDLGDEAAASLADALLVNNALQRLLLDRNRIGCDGAGAIATSLKQKNRRLKHLSLSQNKVGPAGCCLLGQAAATSPSLVVLDLSYNGIAETGIFSLAHSLASSKSCCLQTLNIAYNCVGESIAMFGRLLRCCTQLRELNLEGCRLSNGAAFASFSNALNNNTTLISLSVAANSGLGDSGIRELCEQNSSHSVSKSSLRHLDLGECGFTGVGVGYLAEWLPSLTTLQTLVLSRNSVCTDTTEFAGKVIALLLNGTHAHVLNMSEMKISSSVVDHMVASLRYSDFKVTHLSLRNNDVGDTGFLAVLPVLLHHGRLEYLDVAGANLGQESFRRLPDLFAANPLKYCVFSQTTVLTADDVRGKSLADLGETTVSDSATLPPTCHAPVDLNPETLAPTWGFATHSLAVGSSMRPPHRTKCLHDGLWVHMGRPVKHVPIWHSASQEGISPSIGTYEHRIGAKAIEKMENSCPSLLVSDDQMRREFNALDMNGNGFLDVAEFESVYAVLEKFGVYATEDEVRTLLLKHSGGSGRIGFDQFCIIFLQLAKN